MTHLTVNAEWTGIAIDKATSTGTLKIDGLTATATGTRAANETLE